MKKIIKCILCIFIITISGVTSVYAEEQLNIVSDSYNNETSSSYKSVLDIYKVKLFDSKTSAKKEEIQKEKIEEREELFNGLFSKDNENNDKNEFSEKVESYNLFVKVKSDEKIKYYNQTKSNNIYIITTIILLCLLTGVITKIYYVRKSKGERNKIENNNYAGL
ncbi:MAG TPA: hypothetical protein DG753_12075 [Clostridium sp.]|nr:hypothetical protein [Clostridium sp.]